MAIRLICHSLNHLYQFHIYIFYRLVSYEQQRLRDFLNYNQQLKTVLGSNSYNRTSLQNVTIQPDHILYQNTERYYSNRAYTILEYNGFDCNSERETCNIIHAAFPFDTKVNQNEQEKIEKYQDYQDLKRKIKQEELETQDCKSGWKRLGLSVMFYHYKNA